eukprot:2020322-Prymnesium_polylepis.1
MPRTHAVHPRHVPPPCPPPDAQIRHVPRGHAPYNVPSHVAILNTALHASPHHHTHMHSPTCRVTRFGGQELTRSGGGTSTEG